MRKKSAAIGVLVVILGILDFSHFGYNSVCYSFPNVSGCFLQSNGGDLIVAGLIIIVGLAAIAVSVSQ